MDAATAETLEAARAAYAAKAESGEGDAPYIDFNHEDGPAAAWVKRIYWAGDDPRTGGVRAEVEWSDSGSAAVKGRDYRRFSPCFHLGDGGRITGAPVNMGGLVNRAAFATIGSLFSRAARSAAPAGTAPPGGAAGAATTPADAPGSPNQKNMENPEESQAETEALKAQVADLQQSLAEMAAERDALTAERDALTAKDAAHREEAAKAAVELAAKDGRIAPADDVKEKWVKALLADPENGTALLASLPANPALRAITRPAPAEGANAGTGVTRLKTALRPS